jgi:glycosidase
MKTLFQFLVIAVLFTACATSKEGTAAPEVSFPERAKDMNIYEVNIRQYTPEGTFKAFSPHLPRLKKMGVDILWIMPIQPIGVKNRKGGLGSYYSIQDYKAANPEFGTMEDFKVMVNKAHELGMLVILDWVPNHTAFDHPWTEIVGYHTVDSLGNIIPPNPDWTDVADLNYDNMDMQNDMISDMRFWIKNADIDGFRCDVAGEVPVSFWDRAIDSLKVDKDVFMLAEWDEPWLHSSFHMTYGWGFHHVMNEIAKGHQNADSIASFMAKDRARYPKEAFRMNFTTNHDENSWNGTVFERFGDGHKAFAVLAFTVSGMPLIYSGQEAGLSKRLRFFEKDTIDWSDIKYEAFYTSLLKLKKENPALYNGSYGGVPQFVATGNTNVVAYWRETAGNKVMVVINLSKDSQKITIQENTFAFKDYFTNEEVEFSNRTLAPFQYFVGIKNTSKE